jgi:hypothetical protein
MNKFDKKYNELITEAVFMSLVLRLVLPLAASVLESVLKKQLKKIVGTKIKDDEVKEIVTQFIDNFSTGLKKDKKISKEAL